MKSALILLLLQQASDPAHRIGAGRIEGGWEYIWTSYAIIWSALILYSVFLWLRRPERNP